MTSEQLNSMMGWGKPAQASPYGGTDYLSTLTSPTLAGLDLGSSSQGSMLSGLSNLFPSGFLGSTNADGVKTQGWGGTALSGIGALGNAFLSMQQYGLAKDTLNENKRQFQLNYDNQVKSTNSRLEDRQAARVASSPTAYQSVGDYMKKYGV